MTRIKKGLAKNLRLRRKLRSEMTTTETRLWSKLRWNQLATLKFRRQHGIGPYIVDFYCPEKCLVIEIDGDSHAESDQIGQDQHREAYLKSLGLTVIRYTNDDVYQNIEGVLTDLHGRIFSDSTSPSPPYKKWVGKP